MEINKIREFFECANFTDNTSDFDLNPREQNLSNKTLYPAAVLVSLIIDCDCTKIILTKRSSKLNHHPGQISFPGGKKEPFDLSLKETAIREATEEIGLNPDSIDIIGQLPNHITVSNFVVSPFIASITAPFVPKLDKNEVEEMFFVPFAFLMETDNYTIQGRYWRGEFRKYYTIPYGPYYIWGATARILYGLANRYNA